MKRPISRITVVIPAKNEERRLGRCLAALKRQTTTTPIEIIVIDGNSTDNTVSVAQSYGVKTIAQQKNGKSNAFALIHTAGTGDITCITEADCIVPDTWIETIERQFLTHPEISAVTGIYRFYDSTATLNRLAALVHPVAMRIAKLLFGFYPIRATNTAIQTDVLRAVGGFDPAYTELYDFEISRRLHAKEYTIHFVPTLVVTTSDRRFRGRILSYIGEFSRAFYAVGIRRHPAAPTYQDIR